MTSALIFAAVKGGLTTANLQLILGALLAVSEVLGADPRIKANGILSFVLLQAQNFIRNKKENI
jgi:hypothetical protein